MYKILQVLGSLQRGGAETMVMNIYRNIDYQKVQFDFLVKDRVDNGYEQEVLDLGGNIFHVPSARTIGPINYLREQYKVIKNNGPYQAVHSHINIYSGFPLFAAKLAGIDIRISHSHTTHFDKSFKQKIGKYMIYSSANYLVACGIEAGKALYGEKNFIVLPNAINLEKFKHLNYLEKKGIRRKLGICEDYLVISHVGRFCTIKNHIFILDLIERLLKEKTDFQVLLLGDGELFQDIQNQAESRNLLKNITFLGSVPNVNEYLQASDIFILPSLYEGLPVSLIEAQSTGCYCLCSDRITKEVDIGCGLVDYIPLDISAWRDSIIKIFENRIIEVDDSVIVSALKKHKYDIGSSIDAIYKIYNIDPFD